MIPGTKGATRILFIFWLGTVFALKLLPVSGAAAPAAERGTTNRPPLIQTARELLDLPLTEAKKRYPVHINGRVTYFDPHFRNLYVHDGTGGFWVSRTYRQTNFHAGDLLEIEGVSDAIYGPILQPHSLRNLGSGPIPEPHWTTYDRLASGKEDCEWVQIQGVVRTMAYRLGLLKIDLAVGSDHVPLYLPGFGAKPLPTNLIGAVIDARGVCSMKFSAEAQITGFWFHVPGMEFITVIRPSVEDPFTLPRRSVHSLREWNHAELDGRLKVSGVVTFFSEGRFFLRDETAPLQVRLQQPWVRDDPKGRYWDPPPMPQISPGDVVEAVGYLAPAEYGHVLVDAIYRLAGHDPLPTPARLSPEEALQPKADGELLQFNARLLENESRHSGKAVEQVLLLQSGDSIFEATLAVKSNLFHIAKGSQLRVAGVNSVEADRWLKPRSFRLLLRGPEDVTVLRAASRWTRRDAGKVAIFVTAGAGLGLAWVFSLRRQVRTQTARLSEHSQALHETNELLKTEVAARERAEADLRLSLQAEKDLGQLRNSFVSMVSHQFRTPLGAILSSTEILDFYSDKLTAEKREKHFRTINESVHRMAGLVEEVLLFNRSESGRMEFRPALLDVASLCRQLVDEIQSATSRRCPISIDLDGIPTTAFADEVLLRHILTNLLDNAVKYSAPESPVTLSVRQELAYAVFTVRDRGAGIPPADQEKLFTPFHRGANTRGLPGTGLGMVIVKRCVDRHGGRIEVRSSEEGTTIDVHLPIFVPPRPVANGDTTTFHKN